MDVLSSHHRYICASFPFIHFDCHHLTIYYPKSVAAQQEISSIQNKRGIAFAGAYLGYGFHEDGFVSGMEAAAQILGADRRMPFYVTPKDTAIVAKGWHLGVFEFIEQTGIRAIIGTIFCKILYLLGLLF